MITILDYGAGNLSSVKNALDYLGMDNSTTDNPKKILSAERIILPGVGSFGFLNRCSFFFYPILFMRG